MLIKKIICTLSSSETYEIEISQAIFSDLKKFVQNLTSLESIKTCSTFVIISDENIKPLYADFLAKCFLTSGIKCLQLSFPSGEKYKTRATKEYLEDQMLKNCLGVDTCLIAIGGGVTSDISGYLASTYCRGIPFINIPTSLLSMVDASIGGKNGVNTPFGKNLIGSINQPKKVIIDLETLKTLPEKELKDGFVEVIKHALIADNTLFEYLEKNSKELLTLDSSLLKKVIFESCCIKNSIVMEDQQTKGKRHLLNFGHTIGHALENLTDYSLSHGEAVAIGILVESHIAVQLQKFNEHSLDRIEKLFLQYGLALKLKSKLSLETILNAMTLDKKSLKKAPRFVIIEKIGSCLDCDFNYCRSVDEALIINALEWMNEKFL